jgi:hypothetical protein
VETSWENVPAIENPARNRLDDVTAAIASPGRIMLVPPRGLLVVNGQRTPLRRIRPGTGGERHPLLRLINPLVDHEGAVLALGLELRRTLRFRCLRCREAED